MSDEYFIDKQFSNQKEENWAFRDAKREYNPQASDNKDPGLIHFHQNCLIFSYSSVRWFSKRGKKLY